jgi:hypothetical protein
MYRWLVLLLKRYWMKMKKNIYCIFIDYEKAFDTVNRDFLWINLIDCGISCKLYAYAKSCLMDWFFDITLGLKQEEPLSRTLFFVLSILNSVLILSKCHLEVLHCYLNTYCYLQMIYFCLQRDINSLQTQLNSISRSSYKWGLKMNVAKTKVCVFEKRKNTKHIHIMINDEPIEYVNTLTYLGVKLS